MRTAAMPESQMCSRVPRVLCVDYAFTASAEIEVVSERLSWRNTSAQCCLRCLTYSSPRKDLWYRNECLQHKDGRRS